MISLTAFAKTFADEVIGLAPACADFTAGNGNDTLYLAKRIGGGRVYSFDIQKAAVDSTGELLSKNNVENVTLINDSHANALQYIHEPLSVVMFNLGYLPGGDKTVHTMRESTIIAVRAAMELIVKGGRIIIMVYPGHEEGFLEGDMLTKELGLLDRKKWFCAKFSLLNSPESPFVIIIEKEK